MNKRVETVMKAAARLAPEERIELVQRIMQSVDPTRPEIDAAWLEEARDRIAAYERGEVETFDADEVIAELFSSPLAGEVARQPGGLPTARRAGGG